MPENNPEEYKDKDTDKSSEKTDDKPVSNDYNGLEKQIETEYDRSWKHQKPKKDQWAMRLKLYNNQKRDADAVGDTTMFTIHQTVLASLYDDRLSTDFTGREEGDDEVADNLNAMADADYVGMEKDKIDYDYIWNTTFFGRGILALEEYVREPSKGIYLPLPEVVDPMVFLHDPKATSINGDSKGRGSCGYFGFEISMTEDEINKLPHQVGDLDISEVSHGGGKSSLYRDASEARNNAQNRQTQEKEVEAALGANAGYVITKWYTHFRLNGEVKRVKVWLANERSKILAVEVLENQDYWQYTDRPLYPTAHDWDGTSIPDLTEDKQRARAIAQNLGMKAMYSDLHPSYVYDPKKITNRADLTRIAANKYIPATLKDGEALSAAIQPFNKARPNMGLLDFIYNSLDASAQKATATPDIQQGIQSQKDRPLGETNLIASRVDTRYSLSAKVFGWSEKAFWQQWYRLYKDNFKDNIDEKVLRIEGIFGAKWRPLTRDNIITKRVDPDVKIESKAVSRAKMLEDRQGMQQYLALAFQEPGTNRRYGLEKMGKLYGMEKDELNRLFPPTVDEREAELENESLNEDKLVPIRREQDHNAHLLQHMKANDTAATRAHKRGHDEALLLQRKDPSLFPQQQDQPLAPPGSENTLATPNPVNTVAPSQTT